MTISPSPDIAAPSLMVSTQISTAQKQILHVKLFTDKIIQVFLIVGSIGDKDRSYFNAAGSVELAEAFSTLMKGVR